MLHSYHPHNEGDIVSSSVCLCVCLSVCQQDNSWTIRDIVTKCSGHHAVVKRVDVFENGAWVVIYHLWLSEVLMFELTVWFHNGCRSTNLELSATRDDVRPVAVIVPSASEVSSLQTILSRPRHLMCYTVWLLYVDSLTLIYWFIDWLIDWLCQLIGVSVCVWFLSVTLPVITVSHPRTQPHFQAAHKAPVRLQLKK